MSSDMGSIIRDPITFEVTQPIWPWYFNVNFNFNVDKTEARRTGVLRRCSASVESSTYTEIRCISNTEQFKRHLKTFLFK